MIKLFISGSRFIKDEKKVIEILKEINKEINKYSILVGDCYGVDKLVRLNLDKYIVYSLKYCRNNEKNMINIKVIGNKYENKDKKMCEDCDVGLVFWNGYSKGSENNIKYLKKLNKKVYIVKV